MNIRRRRFVAGAGALGLSGCATATGLAGENGAKGRAPDIVFILADDLGYADVGVYGQRHLNTPHIDSLARDGLTFTHGYANSCICSPTRTALATGLYQQRFALGLQEPLGRKAPPGIGLPDTQPTLASVLRARGYRTALVGKWHLGEPPEHGPLKHGYDQHFGIIQGGADYFAHRIDLSGHAKVDGLYRDDQPTKAVGYMTDLLGDEAVKILSAPREQPLFLSLHFTAPHWPWEGPEDEAVSKALKDIFHRDGGSLETYAEMVRSLDANVGKVLAAIAASGRMRDTIVIFTSDNGGERFSDTWPFTGVKGELLEGGLRVPLLVRWPARIAAGRQTSQVAVSMDFLPTLLAAAGGDPSALTLDGVNLLGVLEGRQPEMARTLFWRYRANEQAAVRHGAFKYLKLGGKEYLFDVVADPRERAQLKDRHPDVFADLKARHAAWNAGMLPYPEGSFSEQVKESYPDRY